MGRLLDSVKNNQQKIKSFTEVLMIPDDNPNDTWPLLEKNYFQEQKERMNKAKECPEEPHWSIYQDRLEELEIGIDYLICFLKQVNKEKFEIEVKQRVLGMVLLASRDLLNQAINYVEITKQENHLPQIQSLQQKVEKVLDFMLERGLKLSTLKSDYDKAYHEMYGTGCFGFFKLPIKCFFRQKSRIDDLQFIENVNTYLQGQGSTFSLEDKVQMQLSALNLLRFKLENETFGQGSQLLRLIEVRLNENGLLGDWNLSNQFIEACKAGTIEVPRSLSSSLENMKPDAFLKVY